MQQFQTEILVIGGGSTGTGVAWEAVNAAVKWCWSKNSTPTHTIADQDFGILLQVSANAYSGTLNTDDLYFVFAILYIYA